MNKDYIDDYVDQRTAEFLPSLATNGIAVIRADGTGPIIQTGPVLSGTAHFWWSPDSTKILMFPDDSTVTNAFLLDPNGGDWTTVPWKSGPDIDWQRIATN